MSDLDLFPSTRAARAEALRAQVDSSTTPGRLQLFTTSRPVPGGAATPVVELELAYPSGVTDATGYELSPVEGQALADAIGIQWGRIVNGDGEGVLDANAGVAVDPPALNPPIVLNTDSVLVGGYIRLVGAKLYEQ